LEITLWMSRWNSTRMLRRIIGGRTVSRNHLRCLAIWTEPQRIRLFLPPFESGLFTVHSQPQIVFVAASHLACPQQSARSPIPTQHHLHVIVEPPSRHKDRSLRCNLCRLQPTHKACQVVRMCPNIAERTCRPTLVRIGTPRRLLLPRRLERSRQPILSVLHLH